MTERILILDFGAQYTQLIARRIREAGVYCEILPCTVDDDAVRAFAPKAIILSGGPASTTAAGAPQAPEAVFTRGVPVLGICYGEQTICAQLGGKVEIGHHREFGRAFIEVVGGCALFEGVFEVGAREQVWMSHGDKVVDLPEGFRVVAISEGSPFAAIADDRRRIYGVQFHPEVVHTPRGHELLANFAHRVAGCASAWTMAAFREQAIARMRAQIGAGRVICGLSGGVNSAVTALLLHEAVGDQLVCILVDTGLLRAGEVEQIVDLFRRHSNIPLHVVDSAESIPRAPGRHHRPGGQAQDHRQGLHRRVRAGSQAGWAAPIFWRRARCIRTSSNRSRSRARASPSSRTTMSAACPSAWR